MNIEIIKQEKEHIEFKTDNITIAELIRKEIRKNDSVVFAGWKREHPLKPLVFVLKTKGDASKILHSTIESLKKENDNLIKIAKKELK